MDLKTEAQYRQELATCWQLIAQHQGRAREAADRIEADAASIAVERSSRGMFVARLDNMQENGNHWLTVTAVLALLNDCDMLAASERA